MQGIIQNPQKGLHHDPGTDSLGSKRTNHPWNRHFRLHPRHHSLNYISGWFRNTPDCFSLPDFHCPGAQLRHTWQGITHDLWSLQNLETLPWRSGFSDQCRHWPQKSRIFRDHQTPHSTTSLLVRIFITIQPHHPFLINDVKLKYLCHNKLPSIIFILMYDNDYVINMLLIRPGVWCWLRERCRKRSSRVVVGRSVDLKRKVDDQTIVGNCKISRTKIGFVESVNGSFPG